jgi:hypothetical protein
MESPYIMLLHGTGVGAVCYYVSRYSLGAEHKVAELRAIIIGLVSSLYMISIGHKLPF